MKSPYPAPGVLRVGGVTVIEQDPLMTPTFLQQFRAACKGLLTLLEYPDGSHGLRENKGRLRLDVAGWVLRNFP